MLVGWIDAQGLCSTAVESTHEQQDHRDSPEQTRLHLPEAVDTGTGPSSSTEYRTPVRVAREGTATGLDGSLDSRTGSGSGTFRRTQRRSRGPQDTRGGSLDGSR